MKREIYVQAGNPREIAVAEDGRLCEYLKDSPAATEAIFLGRVVRVVPGVRAAFVDIGQERNGFLPLEEQSATFRGEPLREGMRVPVQIRKAAQGVKGAFLTRDITLCGEYLLLMPRNHHIGVSARITGDGEKARLKRIGEALADGQFGLVMRNASADAELSVLRDELQDLLDMWHRLEAALPTASAPSMVLAPRSALRVLLDDLRPKGIARIITDDPALTETLKEIAPTETTAPGLMESMGWTAERDRALRRVVWLKSGANLVIDQCEAMTVIDVNTARFTGKRDLEATILSANLEACEEIARQIRLRNLGGIILIDMIDMRKETEKSAVLEALKNALERDRVKTVVHGFTSLGLVEMTRKKTRQPLREEWTTVCPACGGSGRCACCKEEQHD